jgi:hypothetical protein
MVEPTVYVKEQPHHLKGRLIKIRYEWDCINEKEVYCVDFWDYLAGQWVIRSTRPKGEIIFAIVEALYTMEDRILRRPNKCDKI